MKLFGKILLLNLLFAAFCFSGCEKKNTEDESAEVPETSDVRQSSVFAVTTTTAAKGQIRDYIGLSGDIIASSTVDVFSETAGRVAEVYVHVGQRVSRGQNVAAIDPARPGMEFNLSMATAPISGTVIHVPARVGQMVTAVMPALARIATDNTLEIQLFVAERFISKMALNLPCEITLDAWPGEVFRGNIKEIYPTIDPLSRTMEIRVNVRNTDSKLKAGMFAKVRIITESKDNIVKIPVSAMISRFGEQYLYVIEKDSENPEIDIVTKRTVVPGISIDGVLEIQEGLLPGEEIVLRGQTLLSDGVHVNIVERVPALNE